MSSSIVTSYSNDIERKRLEKLNDQQRQAKHKVDCARAEALKRRATQDAEASPRFRQQAIYHPKQSLRELLRRSDTPLERRPGAQDIGLDKILIRAVREPERLGDRELAFLEEMGFMNIVREGQAEQDRLGRRLSEDEARRLFKEEKIKEENEAVDIYSIVKYETNRLERKLTQDEVIRLLESYDSVKEELKNQQFKKQLMRDMIDDQLVDEFKVPKRRGRPKGSKNKPRTPVEFDEEKSYTPPSQSPRPSRPDLRPQPSPVSASDFQRQMERLRPTPPRSPAMPPLENEFQRGLAELIEARRRAMGDDESASESDVEGFGLSQRVSKPMRLRLLRGQIRAGNNNPAIIREYKQLCRT